MRGSPAAATAAAGLAAGAMWHPLEPPQAAPGFLLRRAQQRHTLLWSREFAGDLTGPQYAVVTAVVQDPGLDQGSVAERASLDKSSAADVVARMQAQGWLRLTRDPADGRRKTFVLSPLARAALGELTRRAGLVQQRVLAPLPPAGSEDVVTALRLLAYAGHPPPSRPPDGSAPEVLELRDVPGHLLRRAQQVHTLAWTTEVGRALTPPQYGVLSVLSAHPDGLDQVTGGLMVSLDKSSMADVVLRLERRGLVRRGRDARDGRRRVLTATREAREELRRLTPAAARVQERIVEPVPPPLRPVLVAGLRLLAGDPPAGSGTAPRDLAAE